MGSAVVTGAGRGIGRAIAGRLANDGHRVSVVDIDGVTAKATADAIGGDAYECDVTDRAGVRRLADEIGPVISSPFAAHFRAVGRSRRA